jgi:hypothetical protein
MITEEIASFLASGLSLNVATASRDLEPHGTRAFAAVVEEDREHVVVFVHASAAPELLRDLAGNPRIALTFGRPADHRTAQIKGAFVGSRGASEADRPEIDRQTEGFVRSLEGIGIARAATTGWSAWPAIALRFRATETYEQTPGPGAGERLS